MPAPASRRPREGALAERQLHARRVRLVRGRALVELRPSGASDHRRRAADAERASRTWPALFIAGRRPQVVLVHVLPQARPDWSNSTAEQQPRRAARRWPADEPAPGWSPIATARPSAGSAWRRARTTSASRASKVLAPRRRQAGLVDRLLRRRAQGARPGRRARRCSSARDRLRARTRRDDARGLPGCDDARPGPGRDAFHGSQSMFEKAGFEVVEVRQWNATSPPRPIMRLRSAADRSRLAQVRAQPAEHHRPSRPTRGGSPTR